MNILAIDTSTHWLSVACGVDGVWHERGERAGESSSERVLPMVRAVLDAADCRPTDLTGIAFGAGPGSFTGLRIACGVAQGLGEAWGVPLAPVPTLAALAQGGWRQHGAARIVVCQDARMREVYVAAYERRGDAWHEVAEAAVGKPATVALPQQVAGGWFGVGDGFSVYPELADRMAWTGLDPEAVPRARAVGELAAPAFAAGTALRAEDARPLYVRHKVALTTAQRAAGETL